MTVTIHGDKKERIANAIGFPYTDMSDAIAVAEGMRKGGGIALSRDQLAAAMGLAPRGGGFATKIATARIFGVIDTVGGKYQLTELGHEIVDPSREAGAKIAAFLNVPLFKKAYDEFRGRLLPPRPHGIDAAFVNFGVTEKNVRHARLAFDKSARIAGFFPNAAEDRLVEPFGTPVGSEAVESAVHRLEAESIAAATAVGRPQMQQPTAPAPKQLRYQLIDLLEEPGIGDAESDAIWTLVRFLAKKPSPPPPLPPSE
jgi:hypothetical protein